MKVGDKVRSKINIINTYTGEVIMPAEREGEIVTKRRLNYGKAIKGDFVTVLFKCGNALIVDAYNEIERI